MRIASSLVAASAAAALSLAACTGSRVGSSASDESVTAAWPGYRSVADAYPRRSWHPKDPPACCGGLDIRLAPAPPCAPPPCAPCAPVAVAPCAPPPCAPPAASPCEPIYVPPPPCEPTYVPPPCAPYVPAPCAPAPCQVVPCDPCASPCFVVTPRVRYWRPAPSGDMTITRGGAPGSGTAIDLEDDLDLDTGNAWGFGLDVAYGRHRLRIGYEPLTWHGTSTLSRSVVYHGVTYGVGETVDSDVEMTFWRLGYDFALVDDSCTKLRLGLEGYWWQFDGKLDGSVSGETSRDFSKVYPAIYADADVRFGAFHVRGSAAYGTLFDSDRYILDLEAAVGVRLFGRMTFDVGWRYWHLVFQETTNLGDFTGSGPFAELSIDL